MVVFLLMIRGGAPSHTWMVSKSSKTPGIHRLSTFEASRQGLFWQPVALPLASFAMTFEQNIDAAFPWVQWLGDGKIRILIRIEWQGRCLKCVRGEDEQLVSWISNSDNDQKLWLHGAMAMHQWEVSEATYHNLPPTSVSWFIPALFSYVWML